MQASSFPVRFRSPKPLSPLLLFGLSLMFLLTFYRALTPRAQAEENHPNAPGSISGVVTNGSGEPLIGIEVLLLQAQRSGSYRPTVATTVTAADGTYRFPLLGPAIYLVQFRDPNLIYAPEYYENATQVQTAKEIPIAGNQVTGVDATLDPGGRISGTVSATNGLTVTYTSIYVYAPNEDYPSRWERIRSDFLPMTKTTYLFTGLVPGVYRVCANAAAATLDYQTECFDDVAELQRATDITVTLGVTVSNINFLFGDGADYAEVTGRVTDLAGTPLPAINIQLAPIPTATPTPTAPPAATDTIVITPIPPLPASDPLPTAQADTIIDPYPYYPAYITSTNAAGDYHLPLIDPGQYLLSFQDPSGNYASEYYLDVLFPKDAQVLTLVPRAQAALEEVQLGPAGQITGVVTVLGEVAPSAAVRAYFNAGGSWVEVAQSAVHQQTGYYALRGLPAGVYRLEAYASSVGASYQAFYPNSETIEDATDLSVAVGGIRPNINWNLTNGPTYEGYVSGRVTAAGKPQAGIRVDLQPACCFLRPLTYTFTDEDGTYRLGGLTDGLWTIGFVDPAGVYARTFAGNQPTLEQAEHFFLNQEVLTQTVDAELSFGGMISGVIRNNRGEPVQSVGVRAYLMVDGAPRMVAEDVSSTADGTYIVNSLYPGIYRLCYIDPVYGIPTECYGSLNRFDVYGATDIVVEAEKTTSGIDLTWGPDYSIYLPTVARQQN
ncbi:MAG: carboxypeptidase regulatory-like domain-containing protein [Caldilineaceae bacterium]|nr:carboxypeptidase regulatory-like domain-containing protein [Caldilineaceae bacterium]